MNPRRRRRFIDWDSLEPRECLAAAVGPSAMPISVIPTPPTNPVCLWLDGVYANESVASSPNVAFFGDSITYNFGFASGSPVWAKQIAPLNSEDFGVPGDTTENLLWRLDYAGGLACHPKVAVVNIGINNLGSGQTPQETVQGIEAVLSTIRFLSPNTKVVLVGLLPAFGPDDPLRGQIAQVNSAIAGLANGANTFFLDIGPSLEGPGGSITANFEPDFGHPNQQGYQIWANSMMGVLDYLLDIDLIPAPTPKPTIPRP